MLTDDQITSLFLEIVNEEPDSNQLLLFRNSTVEKLTWLLNRRLAVERDPTYTQRLAENYQQYLAASDEEKTNWQYPDPLPPT